MSNLVFTNFLSHPHVSRPLRNPLDEFNDDEMIKRYRFNRNGIEFITNLVRDDLPAVKNKRNHPVPHEIQVLMMLRYLATNAHQQVIADTFECAQSTVSRCVDAVVKSLEQRIPEFVKFPTTMEEIMAVKKEFYSLANFPGVIGIIDGTHIRILKPSVSENDYINRKFFPSLNVQIVVDAMGRLFHVNCRWPGSSHDSFVLRSSEIWSAFESGHYTGILLGDSGYPLRHWLFTPFTNPSSVVEKRFNKAHRKTRVVVEQTIGRWKRRFAILQTFSAIRVHVSKVPAIVGACAVLHNIAIERGMPDIIDEPYEDEQPPADAEPIEQNSTIDAKAFRASFAETHFG